jgi:ABC-2 type transport system ATP-binding protein
VFALLGPNGAVLADGRIVAAGTPRTVGGRDAAPALVSWRDADGLHEVRTDEPDAVVARLAAGFADLSVARPTLEDVYLSLIGEAR